MVKFFEKSEELIEVAKIHTDNRKETYVGLIEQGWLDSLNYKDTMKEWEKWVEKEDRELLLYMKDGVVAGFAAVKYYEKELTSGILSYLHVRKDMQHIGVGRALIGACASLLLNMGKSGMYIEAVDGNVRAENLYQSLGAKPIVGYRRGVNKRYLWNNLPELANGEKFSPRNFCYDNIRSVINDEFILFGSGEYCDAFMNQFPNAVPKEIFDNNENKQGKDKSGVSIVMPHRVKNVIITACFYHEIEQQLNDLACENVMRFYPWHKY